MKIVVSKLVGSAVTLEPMDESHREGLRAVADDNDIWTHMPASAAGSAFDDWWETTMARQTSGQDIIYVVRQNDGGEIVGSSRYLTIFPAHGRLEIGYTFYAKKVWGTAVNPGAKLLLLGHAFETMGVHRVEFKCDERNKRSAAAIAKLGAKFEGVFREHFLLPSGRYRDSAYYSILISEWPDVKAGLLKRLEA
ncbi:MAG: GNAT family protein [Sphingomonadales bacterium]